MFSFAKCVPRVAAVAAISASALGAQELESQWLITSPNTALVAETLRASDAAADVAVVLARNFAATTDTLRTFDLAGDVVWSESFAAPGVVDVDLSSDASLVLVLAYGPAGGSELRLEARAAATGAVVWGEDLSPPGGGFDGLYGLATTVAGRVAVLQTAEYLYSGQITRFQVRDESDGALIAESDLVFPNPAAIELSAASDRVYAWDRTGRLQAFDAATGASLWNATLTIGFGTAITDLAVSGDGRYLVAANAVQTIGVDALNGSVLWSQPAVQARRLSASGNSRVFGAGIIGQGGENGEFSYGMLNAATGSVLWSGVVPAAAGVFTSLSTARISGTASDEANGQVGFRDQFFYTFDAGTGAPVASVDLGQRGGGLWPWDAGWALGGRPFLSQDGPLLESRTDLGALSWTFSALGEEEVATRPTWLAVDAAGGTVHSLHEFSNPTPLPQDRSFYEVRSIADGSLLHAWSDELPNGSSVNALDPTGTLLAQVRGDFELIDAQTGQVVAMHALGASEGFPKDVQWTPDGSRCYVAWYETPGLGTETLEVAAVGANGALLWTQSLPNDGSNASDDAPVIATRSNGELLIAVESRDFPDPAVVTFVPLDGATGQLAGSVATWGASEDSRGEVPLALHVDEAADRCYAVVLSRNLSFQESANVVAVELSTLTVLAERTLVGPSNDVLYRNECSAMTSDGSALVVAGVGTSDIDLLVTCLELPALDERWEDASLQGPLEAAMTLLTSDRVACVRTHYANSSVSRLRVLDLASGAVLVNSNLGGSSAVNDLEQVRYANDGRRLVLAGINGTATASTLEVLEVGTLLTDRVSITGGDVTFVVDADEGSAGKLYLLAGSATGTAPGLPLGSVVVPLVVDFYTSITIQSANLGPFNDTFGSLDGQGTARAVLQVPFGVPALSGLTLQHAVVAFEPGGSVDFTSEALSLFIL